MCDPPFMFALVFSSRPVCLNQWHYPSQSHFLVVHIGIISPGRTALEKSTVYKASSVQVNGMSISFFPFDQIHANCFLFTLLVFSSFHFISCQEPQQDSQIYIKQVLFSHFVN